MKIMINLINKELKQLKVMGKLLGRYRLGKKLLKVYSTNKGLKGKLYFTTWENGNYVNNLISSADFLESDRDNTIYRVKEYFGMNFAKETSSDLLTDCNHRVIWTNDDYENWKAFCEDYDGMNEEETTYEKYYDSCEIGLDDERCNLNVQTDGVIVVFAVLGLWDGKHNGGGFRGENVKNILYSDCDKVEWYCDRYNVRCAASHHDGTNTYLYRVAKNEQEANKLINKIAYQGMTEKEFMKATKSLRPYISKVYGWK